MVEKTLLDYLNSKMSVPCYMERPEDPPDSYILIERTGARRTARNIMTGTFAIQSIAETLFTAAELNTELIQAMNDFDDITNISHVGLVSYYNYTNPTTHEYRYQAVFEITYMGE